MIKLDEMKVFGSLIDGKVERYITIPKPVLLNSPFGTWKYYRWDMTSSSY